MISDWTSLFVVNVHWIPYFIEDDGISSLLLMTLIIDSSLGIVVFNGEFIEIAWLRKKIVFMLWIKYKRKYIGNLD
jgi:hypothetical protein